MQPKQAQKENLNKGKEEKDVLYRPGIDDSV